MKPPSMSDDCQRSFSGFNTSDREDELIKKRKKVNKNQEGPRPLDRSSESWHMSR